LDLPRGRRDELRRDARRVGAEVLERDWPDPKKVLVPDDGVHDLPSHLQQRDEVKALSAMKKGGQRQDEDVPRPDESSAGIFLGSSGR